VAAPTKDIIHRHARRSLISALFVNLVIVLAGILTMSFSSQTIERDGVPAR
jgi:hypothetical protein